MLGGFFCGRYTGWVGRLSYFSRVCWLGCFIWNELGLFIVYVLFRGIFGDIRDFRF